MRIPFAVDVRECHPRTRSATVTSRAIMSGMDALDMEIQAAAKKRARAEKAFNDADTELRQLLVRGRAEGKGPSEMARLTGFTREWVAKIAPDPKRARDINAARTIAES
jgi:hypothetical protein